MDARVTWAFTPVFDGLCPRMTSQCPPPLGWCGCARQRPRRGRTA